MPGPLDVVVQVKGALFIGGEKIIAGLFEDAIEEAVREGAKLVRDRSPGSFKDAIVGEVRTSRLGRRYGNVRAQATGQRGLHARVPGRRLWLEQGVRIEGADGFDYTNAKKVKSKTKFRGHKMFLRGRQALKGRERLIAQKHTLIALREMNGSTAAAVASLPSVTRTRTLRVR